MVDRFEVDIPTLAMLVDRHSQELYAYLWRMLMDAEDAEDCLQQTFLQAHRNLGRLRPDSNLRAWLYRVAGNVGRSCLRKRRRQVAWVVDDVAEDLPAEGDDPAQNLEHAWIREAMLRLPPRQHEALILRKYQELDYEAIARVQGNSPQAARANVYQALKRLRQLAATRDA